MEVGVGWQGSGTAASSRIVFSQSATSADGFDIRTMNAADGGARVRLTSNAVWDAQSDWWGP